MAAPRRCCPKPRTRRDLRLEGLETRHLLSVEPLGDAFRVNTFVEGDQRAIESANSMAMGRDGNSVVVWQSQNQDGRPSSIRAQRLDPSGRPVGSEMRVDQNVPGFSLSSPSIATNDASGFVISWTSYSDNQLISGDVYSRVFSAAGEPLGDEFLVNNRQVNAQSHPAVAMDSDGDFVVAWSSCYQDTPGCDVYARRFDATGAPRADEARIANVNAQDLAKPSASMSDDGRYVIAWSQNDDIYAQLFAANGAVTRPAFVVNDYNFREQYAPAVAMNSTGEFVVAWNTFVPGGASHGTAARRFDALGQPLDTQIAVGHPPNTEGNVLNADISPDGSFVVAWTGRPNQVFVHGYDRNGIELAPALAVSETAVFGPHYGLAVGMSDDGFMIAWSYDNAGRDYDVYARRYAILPPPAPEIRIIGNRRDIVSGDDAPSLDDFTDFGAAVVPSGIIERTYVVSNEGAGPLVFSGSPRVEIQGAQAGDFRVTWPLPEAIPAGGSATFTIEFQPTQLGLRTAQVRIANDDADEAEFILAIQGIGRDTLAGEIHGAKWNDLNGDGALNEGEPGLADVIIYLDDDGDGRRDASERYTRSGLDGRYQFAGLAPGEYFVAEVLETGWRQTFPGEAHSNAHTVSLSASQIAAGIDFLNQLADPPPTARIDGLSLGSSQSSQSIQLGDGDAQLTNHLANAIDQIVIEFNQPLMIRKEDLSLTDALANEVAIDECSSDGGGAGTMQLTCLFDEPTGIGRFTLRIADTATDRLGARLDGEWQNPNGPGRFGDLFPSGDGEPGGDFSFRFDLNLGDTNLDGRIDISDLNNVRNHFGESANSPGDADGDGDADIGDLNEVRNRFGSTPTAISDSAPSVVLRNLARDAIFGMLTSSAGEKPIRRDIARGNEVR